MDLKYLKAKLLQSRLENVFKILNTAKDMNTKIEKTIDDEEKLKEKLDWAERNLIQIFYDLTMREVAILLHSMLDNNMKITIEHKKIQFSSSLDIKERLLIIEDITESLEFYLRFHHKLMRDEDHHDGDF